MGTLGLLSLGMTNKMLHARFAEIVDESVEARAELPTLKQAKMSDEQYVAK